MPDLIDIGRAKQNASLAALNAGTNSAYLPSLISAASDAVRRYCHRDFTLTAYSEYYNGGIYPSSNPLLLREFPVTEITRIAAYPQPAILILNNDPTTNQRATVQTLANGDVKLVRVASGVTTTSTQVAATNVTLAALVTAVNALGGGWLATIQSNPVTGDFSKWPQADLKPLQGAMTVFQTGAYLELFTEDIMPFQQGWTWEYGWGQVGWRLDVNTGEVHGIFPRGTQNIRIDYSAGFAQVPQAVQEATAQIAQWMYQTSRLNMTMASDKLGDASHTYAVLKNLPKSAEALLNRYVDHAKVIHR